MQKATSTLLGTEVRLAPVTLGCTALCAFVGMALLASGMVPQIGWILCTICWALLTFSNIFYLVRHPHPTVGMIPVSVVSMGPCALAALLSPSTVAMLRGVCVALLVLAIGVTLLLATLFWRMRSAYAETSCHVDDDAVVIVLGGALTDDKPAPTLALRLDVAKELYDRHPRITLVLSGGPSSNSTLSEAQAMARYLLDRGVQQGRLVLECKARNTRENITRSLELVGYPTNEAQLCVITSDYHLYRAVSAGRQAGVLLTPIPAPTPMPGRLQQWCREVLTILATGAL